MKRRSTGFTMLELMVTVVIMVILVAIGVPSFSGLIAAQRVKSSASTLQSYLNLARAEALKRNASVTLSPNASSNWTTGWKVVDASSGTILFTAPAVSNISITGGPSSVAYTATGRVSATADTTFKLSSSSTVTYRCVEVDLSGIAMVRSSGC